MSQSDVDMQRAGTHLLFKDLPIGSIFAFKDGREDEKRAGAYQKTELMMATPVYDTDDDYFGRRLEGKIGWLIDWERQEISIEEKDMEADCILLLSVDEFVGNRTRRFPKKSVRTFRRDTSSKEYDWLIETDTPIAPDTCVVSANLDICMNKTRMSIRNHRRPGAKNRHEECQEYVLRILGEGEELFVINSELYEATR